MALPVLPVTWLISRMYPAWIFGNRRMVRASLRPLALSRLPCALANQRSLRCNSHRGRECQPFVATGRCCDYYCERNDIPFYVTDNLGHPCPIFKLFVP